MPTPEQEAAREARAQAQEARAAAAEQRRAENDARNRSRQDVSDERRQDQYDRQRSLQGFRDTQQKTRAVGGIVSDAGRIVDGLGRLGGAISGAPDTFEAERGQRELRNARIQEQLGRYRNNDDDRGSPDDRGSRGGRDGRDDRGRDDGPRDRNGRPRDDDGRGGRGQSQGQDPRIEATQDYVYELADAARSPAGSTDRKAAMDRAKDILVKPENGLIQSDGTVRFPEGMRVTLQSDGRKSSYVSFEGIASRAPSAEESIRRGVNSAAEQGIGSRLTDADLAALRGAAAPATVTVGAGADKTTTDTPKPETPKTNTLQTDTPKTEKPAASQKEMNQQAQVALERLGLPTGGKNGVAFDGHNSSQDPAALMDGIIGKQSGPSLKKVQAMLGIEQTGQVTPELLEALNNKEKFAALVKQVEAEKGGKAAPSAAPAAPASAPGTQTVASTESPEIIVTASAQSVNRAKTEFIATAIKGLDTDGDRVVSVAEMAAFRAPDSQGQNGASQTAPATGEKAFMDHVNANVKFSDKTTTVDRENVFAAAIADSGLSFQAPTEVATLQNASTTKPAEPFNALFAAAGFTNENTASTGLAQASIEAGLKQDVRAVDSKNVNYTAPPSQTPEYQEPSSKNVPTAKGFVKGVDASAGRSA